MTGAWDGEGRDAALGRDAEDDRSEGLDMTVGGSRASQQSGTDHSPLRSRLIAEADLVMISPPPTTAVRRGGAKRRTRRSIARVTSGTLVACGMAVAVVAWTPSSQHGARGAFLGGSATTQPVAIPTKAPTTSSPTTGSTPHPPPDAHLQAVDLGTGWTSAGAPTLGPNSGLEMWLFSECGTAGHTPPTPVHPMINHEYANPQPNTGGAVVEGIYYYPAGTGPEVMATARAVLAKGCGRNSPESVPGVARIGDDSLVYGLGPARTILVRLGDVIAVATVEEGPGTMSDARVDEIQSAMLARLIASE